MGEIDPAGVHRYGAVVVVPPDVRYTGDIVVSSSADVTATGGTVRGYLVGHAGVSGDVRFDLDGGSVRTSGNRAAGICGFHTSEGAIGVGAFHQTGECLGSQDGRIRTVLGLGGSCRWKR